jgi:hypothetical protein
LAQGLAAVAARLAHREAAAVCGQAAAANTRAKSEKTGYGTSYYLTQELAAVAARLEPETAAWQQAAATLMEALSKNFSPFEVPSLARSFSAVLSGEDFSGQRPRPGALVAALGIPASGKGLLPLLPLLCPAAEPLPCRLSAPQLVELLKQPLCVGEARHIVLAALGARHRRSFAN